MKVPNRLGWIPNSYGRIHLVLFALLVAESRYETLPRSLQSKYQEFCRTLWVFPEAQNYLYIHSILKKFTYSSKNRKLLKLYFALSKFIPSRTNSLDSLVEICNYEWNTSNYRLVATSDMFKMLHQTIKQSPPISLSGREVILLYVRTSDFDTKRNDINHPNSYFDLLENRNSEIRNYEKAIDYLIDLGSTVVRIGRESDKVFVSKRNFVDYATHESASDLYDHVLWTSCFFAISTSGGADEPSILFDKPVLFVDYGEGINREKRGVYEEFKAYLPKTVCWKDTDVPLSIDEINNLGYFDNFLHTNTETLDKWNVCMKLNSGQAIEQAVRDFREYVRTGIARGFVQVHGKRVSTSWINLGQSIGAK
jgi:putative glycosyltransferase (TIGR04372 family)